jgi:hypothetical protein
MRRIVTILLIAALSACRDDPTGPRLLEVQSGPGAAILDAARGGTPGFYFLPPLVPQPSPAGVFDPSLAPVVRICLLSGGECASTLATFTTTSGPGSETVRVDEVAEHYVVNWHTGRFTLVSNGIYRIQVSVGAVLLGYADVEVAANAKDLKNIDTSQSGGLVEGGTLPIKFRMEAGQLVTSEGGTFTFPGGITLTVPPGALAEPVRISLTPTDNARFQAIADGLPYQSHEMRVVGGVQALPHGLRFLAPVAITLPAPSIDPGWYPISGDFDGSHGTFASGEVDLVYDSQAGSVTLNVTHFSDKQVIILRGGVLVPSHCWSTIRSESVSYDRQEAKSGGSGSDTECSVVTGTILTTSISCPGVAMQDSYAYASEGCGEDFQLQLAASAVSVPACRTAQATATVADNSGRLLDVPVFWSVGDPSIAMVEVTTGRVVGVSRGVTTLTPWAGTYEGEPAEVIVGLPPDMAIQDAPREVFVGGQL